MSADQMRKRCTKCTRLLPLTSFAQKQKRLQACCRQCGAAECARRRKLAKGQPLYVANPLNIVLRDMPGSRVSLLGIAEAA